jgi:CRISPR system Cascade subunit CasC
MSRFLQLHVLTFHPIANINRDETGRPKTVKIGNSERIRISSQALKRALRTSDIFKASLEGHLGHRTRRIGEEIVKRLVADGVPDQAALAAARAVAGAFGKVEGVEKPEKAGKGKAAKQAVVPEAAVPAADLNLEQVRTNQLVFVSDAELAKATDAAAAIVRGEKVEPTAKSMFDRSRTAADIAMFGRMVADSPENNVDAAVQVAHAFTTHAAVAETDFFAAVDDWKSDEEDAGAGHLGTVGFGSGVFYTYVCINRDLLVRNLGGDEQVAETAIGAFVEALATVTPTGKQNTFASHARASFIRAEKGAQQPRTLGNAFAEPLAGDDIIGGSVSAIRKAADTMNGVYGACADHVVELDATAGTGSLAEIVEFCRAA